MTFSLARSFSSVCLLMGVVLGAPTAYAQTTPAPTTPQYCHFRCEDGTSGTTQEVSDYDGVSCAGGVFRTAPGSTCVARCNEVCTGRGQRCATSPAPACDAPAPTQWSCSCPCHPRMGGGTDISQVVSDTSFCVVSNGNPDASSCRSSCPNVCERADKEFDTTASLSCRPTPPRSTTARPATGSVTPATAPPLNISFPDPLGGNVSVNSVIGGIVKIVVGLSGVLFVGVFIWSGFMYMTSGGDGKQAGQAKSGIKNAVIGLCIVMLSYVLVSFVIESANRLQGGAAAVDPPASTRPATTSGRSSTSTATAGDSSFGAAGTPAAPGSAQDACRRFYGGDPSTCVSSGSCPIGVTSFEQLLVSWASDLPGGGAGAPACRACIQEQIDGAQGIYPGLDNTCIPALTNAWRGVCSSSCSRGGATGGTAGTSGGDVCDVESYNIHSRDAGSNACNQCIAYWSDPDNAPLAAGASCSDVRSKAAVWCVTHETRAHHDSPGYCNLLTRH